MPTARRSRLPRKPTFLKQLKGTLHEERVNPREPRVPIGIPPVPAYLGPAEREAWAEFADVLTHHRTVSPVDFAAFELMACLLAASRKLHAAGEHSAKTTRRGLCPALRAAYTVDRHLLVLLKRFGIGPGEPSAVPLAGPAGPGLDAEFG